MSVALCVKRERLATSLRLTRLTIPFAGLLLFANGCGKQSTASGPATKPQESQVRVMATASTVLVDTSAAEFTIAPNGYVAASLLTGDRKISLDDAGSDSGVQVAADAKELPPAVFDVAHAQISETHGRLGTKGKRVEITGGNSAANLEESLMVEVYDDFPQIALVSVSIRNAGKRELKLDTVDLDRHRFNASLADSAAAPNEMWSFHGASIKWGKDNVFEIPRNFSQQNQMGSLVEVKGDLGRVGGGIPVVAFWVRTVGEAIGHVETLPLVLSIPVKTESDGHVDASVHLTPSNSLQPGETYSTPWTFIAVYAGDYYEPLRIYSDVIDGEGLKKPTNNNEDYAVSWCGWGYLRRDDGANAGHNSEAQRIWHPLGDARRSLVQQLWRLAAAQRHFSRREFAKWLGNSTTRESRCNCGGCRLQSKTAARDTSRHLTAFRKS